MTKENFVYWLQGFFEIQKPLCVTQEQVTEIKNHIEMVLNSNVPPSGSIIHAKPNNFSPSLELKQFTYPSTYLC